MKHYNGENNLISPQKALHFFYFTHLSNVPWLIARSRGKIIKSIVKMLTQIRVLESYALKII